MAIFGKFGGSSSNEPNPADYSPEKAQKFFDHARTAADTENYEYAIQHFCNGLKQDPRQKAGFDGLWGAVSKFKDSAAGKKGLSKETWRAIAGTGDVSRFVSAVLEWMITFGDVNLALKAAELGGKVKAEDVGATVADQAMTLIQKTAKPRKDHYLKVSDAYRMLGRHDRTGAADDPLRGDLN